MRSVVRKEQRLDLYREWGLHRVPLSAKPFQNCAQRRGPDMADHWSGDVLFRSVSPTLGPPFRQHQLSSSPFPQNSDWQICKIRPCTDYLGSVRMQPQSDCRGTCALFEGDWSLEYALICISR